jgi:hypothetical protein
MKYFSDHYPTMKVVPFSSYPREGTVTAEDRDETKRERPTNKKRQGRQVAAGVNELVEVLRQLSVTKLAKRMASIADDVIRQKEAAAAVLSGGVVPSGAVVGNSPASIRPSTVSSSSMSSLPVIVIDDTRAEVEAAERARFLSKLQDKPKSDNNDNNDHDNDNDDTTASAVATASTTTKATSGRSAKKAAAIATATPAVMTTNKAKGGKGKGGKSKNKGRARKGDSDDDNDDKLEVKTATKSQSSKSTEKDNDNDDNNNDDDDDDGMEALIRARNTVRDSDDSDDDIKSSTRRPPAAMIDTDDDDDDVITKAAKKSSAKKPTPTKTATSIPLANVIGAKGSKAGKSTSTAMPVASDDIFAVNSDDDANDDTSLSSSSASSSRVKGSKKSGDNKKKTTLANGMTVTAKTKRRVERAELAEIEKGVMIQEGILPATESPTSTPSIVPTLVPNRPHIAVGSARARTKQIVTDAPSSITATTPTTDTKETKGDNKAGGDEEASEAVLSFLAEQDKKGIVGSLTD